MRERIYKCKRCGHAETKEIGRANGCTQCRNAKTRERYWLLREVTVTWEDCFQFIAAQLFRFQIQVSPEDADLAEIEWLPCVAGGYACKTIKNKSICLHRLVIERMFGYRPKVRSGFVIDHINRDKLDNRRENLRIVPFEENIRNRDWYVWSKNSYTEPTEFGKWRSRLRVLGVSYELGHFDKREDAHAAAIAKRKELGLSCVYKYEG